MPLHNNSRDIQANDTLATLKLNNSGAGVVALEIGAKSTAAKQNVIISYSFGYSSDIQLRRANAGNTAVSSGQVLSALDVLGFDGATYKDAAILYVIVDGAVTPGYMPGRFSFFTTNSAGVTAERLRITSGGDVAINSGRKLLFDDAGAGGDDYVMSDTGILKIVAGSAERISCNATGIGLNGSTPVAKPTITGSRSANTVQILTDLLNFWHTRGDIVDLTTA